MNARTLSLISIVTAVTILLTAPPAHAVDFPPVPANNVALSTYGGIPGAAPATIVSAFDQAFARLKSLGGGTLTVPPGVYGLGNNGTARTAIVANDLRNVVISAYGAQLTMTTTAVVMPCFLQFNNPNNVTVAGLAFTDFGTDLTVNWRGAVCISVNASVPSSGFRTVDCLAERVVTFFRAQGDHYTFTGFDINATVRNSYYAVNPNTQGRYSRCNVTCVNVRRGFISYGARDWDIRMSCHSTGAIGSNGFIDLIPDSANASQDCTVDLTVTGTTNPYGGLIHFYHQQSGFQYLRNVRANVTLTNATGTAPVFLFTHGLASTTVRTWEQVVLTGTVVGGYSGRMISNPSVSTGSTNDISVAANLAAYQDMSLLPSYFRVVAAATPPAITTQPMGRSVMAGQTATFSVSASGSGPLSYQWRRNGAPLAGATASSYTTPPTTVVDSGARYDVRVANSQGSATSVAVTLTVTAAPTPTDAIDPARITKELGVTYIAAQDFGTAADTSAAPTASILRVFEDGRELGPAHSAHADIRTIGGGRFSHWSNGTAQSLYFSTSDNSDPRTNGRRYTFSLGSGAGGTGTILREWWSGGAGSTISAILAGGPPSGTAQLTSFEAPTSFGDAYATRVRGWVVPPIGGAYTFWIAGDDQCQLWLSTSADPAHKQQIARVAGWTNPRQWTRESGQRSAAITLVAGQRYYIEALHQESHGGDHLAVGWLKPGQTGSVPSEIIPGSALAPWTGSTVVGTLPSGWITGDVGIVSPVGHATHAAGTWTVAGAGTDIWGTADGFRYVYRPFSGDGEIVARVASQTRTNAWAKAGVMIRESTAAGSRYAMMAVTPANGVTFQRRVASGGSSSSTAGSSRAAPIWLKLVRVGSTVSGYESTNGFSWTLVGSITIAMGANVSIGLAVTSHQNGSLSSATFTNVTVIAAPTGSG